MGNAKKTNQGFSLIELLIAMTILSIIMIMIVQFMSTSSGAYRKTKKNLNIQTESMQVMEQMADTLMQANYVRVSTKDDGMYTITKTDKNTKNQRVVDEAASYDAVKFDFVPDNYGNYALNDTLKTTSRGVIVDFTTFEVLDSSGKPYPLDTDSDFISPDEPVRSFRYLKSGGDYQYIKPEFIYAEYARQADDGTAITVHVIYYITDITDTRDNTCSIYVNRYETQTDAEAITKNYEWARQQMLNKLGASVSAAASKKSAVTDKFTSANTTITGDVEGLLTDRISDFYLSADSEGNAFLANILFVDEGYEYNVVETISFRNSNVLTVRPQQLYKKKGTGTP